MERTIKVDDLLWERVENAKEEVKDEIVDYLNDNELEEVETQEELEELIEKLEDLKDYEVQDKLNHNGRINEIIDGCVPIYTYDIKTAFFLHSDELEEAYENSGIGDNPMENDGMTAIYVFIEQEVNNDFEEILQEAVEEVVEKLKEDNEDLPSENDED